VPDVSVQLESQQLLAQVAWPLPKSLVLARRAKDAALQNAASARLTEVRDAVEIDKKAAALAERNCRPNNAFSPL
jgi:hypothetical protein